MAGFKPGFALGGLPLLLTIPALYTAVLVALLLVFIDYPSIEQYDINLFNLLYLVLF
jgi:hypothetical protein